MNKTQKTILVAAILGTVSTVVHFMSMQNVFSVLVAPAESALPIILAAAVATVFAWLAWAQESGKFAMIAAVIYVSIVFFWGTGLFLYFVPAVLLIVCIRRMK